MNKPEIRSPGLYAITPDRDLFAERTLIEKLLQEGLSLMQYRRKTADSATREREVRWLLELCRNHGCPLLINDDVALCQQLGADGVHLGRDDEAVAIARSRLGPQALIGASAYDDVDRALRLRAEGADYVAFGRLFPSASKPGASPADLSVLASARQRLDCPVVAIGGITRERAPAVFAAGADLCAMIGGLFDRR